MSARAAPTPEENQKKTGQGCTSRQHQLGAALKPEGYTALSTKNCA
ncbi:hypothetical protein A2U01_0056250 [Trifolium medium]|uniref:Uncharacterized protein n=1 Tax=Trifolium medium TaxID=97028 RepID=A0A392RFJ8_9FABA|nr:hypothetical protein [Trifolium medium]